MKPIDQMTLPELADAIWTMDIENWHVRDKLVPRLRAIHNLTRWIPVSERTPTEKDGPSVLVKSGEVTGWYRVVPYMYANSFNGYSHWKRVEP